MNKISMTVGKSESRAAAKALGRSTEKEAPQNSRIGLKSGQRLSSLKFLNLLKGLGSWLFGGVAFFWNSGMCIRYSVNGIRVICQGQGSVDMNST